MNRGGPSVWRSTHVDPSGIFSPAEVARARTYQRPLRRMRALRTIGSLVLLAVLVAVELGPRLVQGLGVEGWVAQLLVVLVAVELFGAALDVPLDAWVDLRHDRRWGLSTQTARGLLRDELVSLALSTVLAAVVLVPVYALVRATTWWWVWAWGLFVALAAGAAMVVPVVVAPLFNRFEPLPEGDLLERVRRVAQRAGVVVGRVEVADESRRSRRDNAYVAGLGPTRRVVLHDTLLDVPAELVEQVVAHELGHVRRHHLRRQLLVVGVVAFVVLGALGAVSGWDELFTAVGLTGAGDPAGLPLAVLAASLVSGAASPVAAWFSRASEREADQEALELQQRPDLVEAMLRRLHVGNLADLDPGRFDRLQGSHPSAAERIAFVRAWAAAHSVVPARR